MQGRYISTTVAGVTFENRQEKLRRLLRSGTKASITLKREPENAYDRNAIAVLAHADGEDPIHVGYLRARLAKWLAPKMDGLFPVYVMNWDIHGGTEDKPTLGIFLKLWLELE